MSLPRRWLACDPGEEFGWSVWSGDEFVYGDQTPMWPFADAVWHEALSGMHAENGPLSDEQAELAYHLDGISLIVCEDWRLYPWELKTGSMAWDECRTARVIGSLFQACRLTGWTWEVQGAKIKERAIAAGAESFFERPLKERRHTNDSRMHAVYRIAKERGAKWTDLSNGRA